MLNAFTVDFEDWYQGLEIYKVDTWQSFESRIEGYCHEFLEILDRHTTKATFFVLGYIAEKYPQLIRSIHDAGHEIGSHGYGHNQIFKMTPEEFTSEVVRTSDAIMNITGKKPIGFRAPIFSITSESLWALDVLVSNGYKYDSSIFPVFNYRYGVVKADRFRHTIVTEKGNEIDEIPVATGRLMGINLPVGGGAYFRIWPYAVTRWGIRQMNRAGHPAVFYIHPWEIDPHQPRIEMPRRIRITHYHRLGSTKKKLEMLFSDFNFAGMSDVFGIEY
jgi:polysaccharide deacetylase family protein (PEP-CTERM system associated)